MGLRQGSGQVSRESVETGTLTVAGFTGTPVWKEESGSPYTATVANSINPSSLDRFDTYLIYARIVASSGNANNITMQVGGDTNSNYTETQLDGTQNTGQTEWGDVSTQTGGKATGLWLELFEFQDGIGMANHSRTGQSAVIDSGFNIDVSWPLSQFTLSKGQSADWTVNVWGRDE